MTCHSGIEVLTSHHVVLSSPFPLHQDNRNVSNGGYLLSLAVTMRRTWNRAVASPGGIPLLLEVVEILWFSVEPLESSS